eukprot:gene598-414_t
MHDDGEIEVRVEASRVRALGSSSEAAASEPSTTVMEPRESDPMVDSAQVSAKEYTADALPAASATVDAVAASNKRELSEAHFSIAVAQGLDEHVFILDGSAFARASSCVYDGFERAAMGIGIELRPPLPPPLAQRATGAATTNLAAAWRSHRFLCAGAGRRHPPLRQHTAALRQVTLPLSVSPLRQLLAAVRGSTGTPSYPLFSFTKTPSARLPKLR